LRFGLFCSHGEGAPPTLPASDHRDAPLPGPRYEPLLALSVEGEVERLAAKGADLGLAEVGTPEAPVHGVGRPL
jgi:hypothetical protein